MDSEGRIFDFSGQCFGGFGVNLAGVQDQTKCSKVEELMTAIRDELLVERTGVLPAQLIKKVVGRQFRPFCVITAFHFCHPGFGISRCQQGAEFPTQAIRKSRLVSVSMGNFKGARGPRGGIDLWKF